MQLSWGEIPGWNKTARRAKPSNNSGDSKRLLLHAIIASVYAVGASVKKYDCMFVVLREVYCMVLIYSTTIVQYVQYITHDVCTHVFMYHVLTPNCGIILFLTVMIMMCIV